jgi:hypothetical protein
MRGSTTIMSTAMTMIRPMRNMACSFQWRRQYLAAVGG